MGDARGEARCCGLVCHGQPEGPGQGAHADLGEARLGQGAQDAVLGGGPPTGAVGGQGVVGVLAVGDGVEVVLAHDRVVDGAEQGGLAVVAAVQRVDAVGGQVGLAGVELQELHADVGGEVAGDVALVGGQRGGDPQQRDHVVGAEFAGGDGQEEGRVHAAGEGDAETADAGHLCGQGIVGLLVGGGEGGRGTAHVKNATIGGISNN